MKCYIKKQFDKREVGVELDLHESIAKRLEQKGFVAALSQFNLFNAIKQPHSGHVVLFAVVTE